MWSASQDVPVTATGLGILCLDKVENCRRACFQTGVTRAKNQVEQSAVQHLC